MSKTRTEFDSIGAIQVPNDKYWGAQTQRALANFQIGAEIMPKEIITSLALIKQAAAMVNADLGVLAKHKVKLITEVCARIKNGELDEHFPLTIWQSGSGTQTNMNINEVIANLTKLHPNDDVNKSQSTNDVFPTAMHIASLYALKETLLPALQFLRQELYQKQKEFNKILKIGRTHLQDALPMTVGQEFSGYVAQLDFAIKSIRNTAINLKYLSIGGTAIGTGLNAPKLFAKYMTKTLTDLTGLKLVPAPNKFCLLASHDALLAVSGTLKGLACALFKITNDIRWLASGPNCGLGELILPDNEPGSSIMPGKVNPTQCEAMLMVCAQVIGNDAVVGFANSQGNFELNVFKPVIVYNILQAINLLSASCWSFGRHAIANLKVNQKKLAMHIDGSLMLVTALNPVIGYDKACLVVQTAAVEGLSLRQASVKLGFLTAKEFDVYVQPKKMI